MRNLNPEAYGLGSNAPKQRIGSSILSGRRPSNAGISGERPDLSKLRESISTSGSGEDDSDESTSKDAKKASPRQNNTQAAVPSNVQFEQVLVDKDLIREFYKYLNTVQSKHVLEFFEHIETIWRKQNFQDGSESGQKAMWTQAQSIFDRWMSYESEWCLSVADGQRGIVTRAIKAAKIPVNPKLFDTIASEITHQLKGHFVAWREKAK